MIQHPAARQALPNPYPKPRFWTRMKVGAVAAIVGVIVGAALVTEDPAEPEVRVEEKIVEVPAEPAAEDSTDRVAELQDELQQQRTQHTATVRRIRQQGRTQVARAVRVARAEERRAARRQLRLAVRAAIQDTAPVDTPPAPSGTDPQFSYCYEANDAGYGPYTRGIDPEYDWYDDRDGDGVVCES